MAGTSIGVSVGGGKTNQGGSNGVRYRGDSNAMLAGPLSDLLLGSLAGYRNSGALADMILGGRGFGQSRRYRQYNPYDPKYGYIDRYNQRGQVARKGPDEVVRNPRGGTAGGDEGGDPNMVQSVGAGDYDPAPPDSSGSTDTSWRPGGNTDRGGYGGGYGGGGGPTGGYGDQPAEELPPDYPRNNWDPTTGGKANARPLGPGQWDEGGDDVNKLGFSPDWYDEATTGTGSSVYNTNWETNDAAPVPGQGLLGAIENYGQWNDIDNRLKNDLGWQATGDLMDLENRELGRWEDYGRQNALETALGGDIARQRSGDLSSLESEAGGGWRSLAGPGQYDRLRGGTLTGMVQNPGLSASEKSAMLSSQTRPIQTALEAQRLEQDAREAASGNAAGRWGASNALALNAAGQAAQAGRNVETAAADYMRKDRAEGLSGLGSLQSQIDARKAQGTQGLQSLSQQQRANQQFGINAGLGLNEQQRAAQAKAAEGVGNLGQRQRANTQWGLGALSDFNKEKTGQELQRIGLTKDIYDTTLAQQNKDADRAAQLSSLVAGGNTSSSSSGINAGLSV